MMPMLQRRAAVLAVRPTGSMLRPLVDRAAVAPFAFAERLQQLGREALEMVRLRPDAEFLRGEASVGFIGRCPEQVIQYVLEQPEIEIADACTFAMVEAVDGGERQQIHLSEFDRCSSKWALVANLSPVPISSGSLALKRWQRVVTELVSVDPMRDLEFTDVADD